MTFLARSWNHEFRVTSVYDKRYGVVEQDLFFGMSIARVIQSHRLFKNETSAEQRGKS